MRRLSSWGIELALVLALSNAAQAQLPSEADLSSTCAPEVGEGRRLVLEVEGQAGIWFHGDVASCMAARLALLPAYARLAAQQEQRDAIAVELYDLQERRAALAIEQAATAEAGLRAAESARDDAVARLNAWWRSPALWASIGALLGVGVIVAAAQIPGV